MREREYGFLFFFLLNFVLREGFAAKTVVRLPVGLKLVYYYFITVVIIIMLSRFIN